MKRLFTFSFIVLVILFSGAGGSVEESPVRYDVTSPLNQQASFDTIVSNKKKSLVVAYMPPATEFNFYLDVGKGIKSIASSHGHDFFMFAPQTDKPAQQMKMLKEVIRRKVDAIILSTHDPNAASPLIKKAIQQGIVVVIINSDSPDFLTSVHAVVGYRQRMGTEKLGRYVLTKLNPKRNIKVGIIEGAPGYHSTERVGGFMDAIANSKLKIVASANGKWNTEGGYVAALEMFKAHPDIRVVFAANDFEILGVSSALQTLGIGNVILLGNDGDPAALERIEAGYITATVNTDPVLMGKVGMQVVLDSVLNKFHGGFVETPTVIVDQSNVLEHWKPPIDLPGDNYHRLRVVSDELPELSGGNNHGLYLDILREIFEPKGIKVDLIHAPYARGVRMVETQQIDALLGATRGDVEGAIFPQWHYSAHIISIIYIKNKLKEWKGQDSLNGKRVAWIRKYNYHQYLYVPVLGSEHSKRGNMLEMLGLGRVDFVMDNEINLRGELRENRSYYESKRFMTDDYQIEEVLRLKLFLAFANTKKGAEFARIFDQRFALLLASGRLKTLFEKWHVSPFPFRQSP